MMLGMMMLCASATSSAQIGVMITVAPPPLPVYEQPLCPGDGYLWTPGYWAWDDDFGDYYWVPGTWVMAPEVGFLWTPPYWGWGEDRFLFHEGYWGPTIGFYGGINYGFGYFGVGFEGGRWDGGHFFYNRAVMNVNVTEIHNVYNTTVVNNNNHVSFNGHGGIDARPTPQEEAAGRDRHIAPVAAQTQHRQEARSNPQQRASENRGKPAVAATARPGDFKGGAVQAREAGGTYNPPANRGGNQGQTANRGAENRPAETRTENNAARPSTAGHVRDLPPAERPAAPNTGNANLDKKYQQQQEKQYAKQNQERQKLAQQQQKEDQKVAKQNNDARKQQVEQQHQQQTQQLQQRHQQQTQQMQQRMQPRAAAPERSRPPK
jgi:DNA segregation ATPase FtsK/SpoIIIE-like protein